MKRDTAGLEELLHGSVLPQVGQKMHPSPLSITLGWEHCPGTECSARSAMSSARPAGSFPLSSAITALCQGYRNHCQIKCFDFTPCKTAWRQCILCWLRCLCQSPFPSHREMQLQRGHWQDLSEQPVCSGFNGVLISLNIEVLFLQGPCVYGEHQQKSPKPKIGCESSESQRGSSKDCLAVSGGQNSTDFKAIEKKVTA